ncbi:methionine ABC transporter ATP-binding protein [Hathewaya massiliensis]|uniref:methionine ABC transporter ATP-binding protein n=1 Tax=Hathewaya massiliensis TaxID=1964382 RepID=UPI001156DE11|nr:methionine ABC transporter ATP-binding protein [Hathewaya massiliensis]
MIKIQKLQKQFGSTEVIKGLDLHIKKGEIYGIAGQSGSGKSTLLRCINGLITYDGGSIKVDNKEVKDFDKNQIRIFRKDVGMIFQQFSLLDRLSVYDNISLPMKMWKYEKKEINKKVEELAEIIGISDKLSYMPYELSGGQKQRVAIARALTMNPKIILSDESTSALDPKTTKSILGLLDEVNKKFGITIVLVTHQMEVIREICDNVSVMENGVFTAVGSPKDVFFNQEDRLKNLLGENRISLPSEGVNIKLMLNQNSDEKYAISDISHVLDTRVMIVDGAVYKFRNGEFGKFIINFDRTKIESIKKILNEKHIEWKFL